MSAKSKYRITNTPGWCGDLDSVVQQAQTARVVRNRVECRIHRHGFRFPMHAKLVTDPFGIKKVVSKFSKKKQIGLPEAFHFPHSDPENNVLIAMPKLKSHGQSRRHRLAMYYEGAIAEDYLPELAPFISEADWATMISAINTSLSHAMPYEADVQSYRGGVTSALRTAMDANPDIFLIFHIHVFIVMTTSGTHVERRLHHIECRYRGEGESRRVSKPAKSLTSLVIRPSTPLTPMGDKTTGEKEKLPQIVASQV
jgi:hypothetical protein